MLQTIVKTASVDSEFHKKLDEFLNQLTYLYNCALKERIEAYKKCGKSISYEDQAKSLTDIRNDSLLSEFEKFSCHIQQRILKRLQNTYERFFKYKKGFPRFKSRKRRITSFESYKYGKPKKIGRRTYLKIKGLGRFSFKGSMPEGVSYIRIVKTAVRIEIQFICEVVYKIKKGLEDRIGIDLGITNRLAFSDETFIKGNKIYRRKLKRLQRLLSRAIKGSGNRKKKVTLLSKEWNRVTVKERNADHRLTTEIVNKSNNIAMEDLKTSNLMKNKHLSRSISEQRWGRIKQQLTYKVESTGGQLVLIPPHHTSQTCFEYGHINEKNRKEEVFKCLQCGHEDTNASKNVLNRSYSISGGKSETTQVPERAENVLTPKATGIEESLLVEQYA